MVQKMILSIKQNIEPFLHQRVLIIYPLRGRNQHDVKNNNELIFYGEQKQDLFLKDNGNTGSTKAHSKK
jgi:hypothetical protein